MTLSSVFSSTLNTRRNSKASDEKFLIGNLMALTGVCVALPAPDSRRRKSPTPPRGATTYRFAQAQSGRGYSWIQTANTTPALPPRRSVAPIAESSVRIGNGRLPTCRLAISSKGCEGVIANISMGRKLVWLRCVGVNKDSVALIRFSLSMSTERPSRKILDIAWPAICAKLG